jgi:hypothetical protein
MKWKTKLISTFVVALPLLASCSYNPFASDNYMTGTASGALIGTGVGVGGVALFRGSKTAMVLGGVTGGLLGYYVTTLRFDSGGIIQSGGQVYTIGDNVGIYIPADQLFQPNSTEFTPNAIPILESVSTVLNRYPNNNVLISGSTTGFGRPGREQKLSQARAQKIAAYLWSEGHNQFKDRDDNMRKLRYVGYGNYFPISHPFTNESLRMNNRIQITSYPSICELDRDKRSLAFENVGGADEDDDVVDPAEVTQCHGKECD